MSAEPKLPMAVREHLIKGIVSTLPEAKQDAIRCLLNEVIDLVDATTEAEAAAPDKLSTHQPGWMAVVCLIKALKGELGGPFYGDLAFTLRDNLIVNTRLVRTLKLGALYYDIISGYDYQSLIRSAEKPT